MALENAAIAKIVGGVTVIGGTTALGVVYKNDFLKWINSETNSYLVQVSETVTEFDENYSCFSTDDKQKETAIDCEINKITSSSDKKHINLSALKKEKIKAHTELKQNSHYVLTIDESQWKVEEKIATTAHNLIIKSKDKKKEYVKLKVIASLNKKNNKSNGEKIEYFLGKISDIKTGTTANENLAITSNPAFKCSFDLNTEDTKKLACEIFVFANDQDGVKKLPELVFSETTSKISDNTTIDKNKYYLIKMTDDNGIGWSIFKDKQLIFSETGSGNNKKVITFSETTPAIVATIDTSEKNLLLIDQ